MRFVLVIALLAVGFGAGSAEARGGSYGYQGGHYAGGSGSSHKGGTYKNSYTNDHYTSHQ